MDQTLVIPNGYKSKLNLMHTEIAINELKSHFEDHFARALNVIKVSAPLLVNEGTGINDNLNGIERTVSFQALDINNSQIEVVQSLAKWKRIALARYGFASGEGLYTNMNAIRRDEILDNLHSLYVDQWDWEKVILKEERNLHTLKTEVKQIYKAMKATENYMHEFHPALQPILPDDIYFITTQELEDLYPSLTPKQREDAITKEHKAVFVMQIGGALRSGEKHDGRSPDYDDWALNGDILFWNPLFERAFEVSSMGIRVDKKNLLKQLKLANNEERRVLAYHQAILSENLPYTIGGGIGQSRLCMFFLKKAHIGEVQASIWNHQILKECEENNITLL
ncbi:aspartate--ammonia ligase [Peribacillus asahii]|uniref:Aspartate--ammonia ligase n=1 Tax=Peribacillus asahii TaxID=228899 RepID=A0A3T0KNV0_9BACI|nr:aspartate--ammonia ligase [Peribacillus asahii]AZV41934.1 asparagine synthase [Peribacillus asahii]USK87254.1 aspartate--ammonia ligase [Peribacillus asahii]